jgi:alkaline phosphatase D
MADKKKSGFPRRRFLQGLAAAPLVLSVPASADEEVRFLENRRAPMLQGWSDENTALVVVLGKASWSFQSGLNSKLEIEILKIQQFTGTDQVLYHLQILGLSPLAYSQIRVLNAQGQVLEIRSLKGLDLKAVAPKIAVVSCANYRKEKDQALMYVHVREQNPDLMLFIGDIVYGDTRPHSALKIPESPDVVLEHYLTTWNTVDLYQLEPLIPTLATWDDHDYGANDGNSSRPRKDEVKNIFRAFYPLPETHPNLNRGPGVAFRLRAFGIDFYMLDDRTDFVPHRTQWGADQETWLAQDFNSSPDPAWLLNGTQYFRYFAIIESVEKKARPSLEMLKNLLRERKKPAVLFSGDVHSSQVQELSAQIFGFKTYEITSSGIHCNSAGSILRRSKEDGQLFYYGENNFLIVRPTVQFSMMELDISCVTEDGNNEIFSQPLRIAV